MKNQTQDKRIRSIMQVQTSLMAVVWVFLTSGAWGQVMQIDPYPLDGTGGQSRCIPDIATGGEYVLNVAGHTGGLPTFQAVAAGPSLIASGTGPVVIEFDAAMRIDTLDATDLTIDGVAATAVTAVSSSMRMPSMESIISPIRTAPAAMASMTRTQSSGVQPCTLMLAAAPTLPARPSPLSVGTKSFLGTAA